MLSAVAERCPALLPMMELAYGRHGMLYVQQTDQVINSESRMRQGDPLGMLLFPLTIQGPLKKAASMNLARPVAFADDTFLQGAPEPTMKAFQVLVDLTTPLGRCNQPSARPIPQTPPPPPHPSPPSWVCNMSTTT
jgi:hypothetical protein